MRLAILVATVWTVILGASLAWGLCGIRRAGRDSARQIARSAFHRDLAYCRWVADRGGVYAPRTDETPPNPYLDHVAERDITTPSGRRLTLINPACMTRQVHTLAREPGGLRTHITSLEPIRPENAADAWETRALRALGRGEEEVSSIEMLDGEPYMRLMRALSVEEACLKCHAAQGYEIGDIRGGISVSTPMGPITANQDLRTIPLVLGHLLVWLLGLGGTAIGFRGIRTRSRARDRALARLEKEAAERTRGAEALQASAQQYRAIAEDMPVLICRFLPGYRITYVNEVYCAYFERTREELIGKSFLAMIPEEDRERVAENIAALSRDAPVHTHEHRVRAPDGRVRWQRWKNRALFDARDRLIAYQSMGEDITESVRDKASIDEWRRRYEAAVLATGSILYDWDSATNDVVYGGSLENVLGYDREEMRGGLRRWLELIHPEDIEGFRALIADLRETGRPAHRYEYRVRRKDGEYITVEDSGRFFRDVEGNPKRMVGFVRDVSDREAAVRKRLELEHQLVQSQKLESVGRLAGGIAHDFNNLLTVMGGYGEVILARLGPDHPLHNKAKELTRAAERAAALTHQLLAFSRRQVLDPRILDLNVILLDLDRMLRRLIGEDIRFTTRPGEGLWSVSADPSQIEQVIVNLVVNARDAMPKGGSLTLETRNVDLDEEHAAAHPESRPGRHVLLAVTDTGCGMSPEIREKVFEPFFTTKERGKGSGLGLATAYGIVKQSGGAVLLRSEVGKGTSFEIYLPAVEAEAEAEADSMTEECEPAPGGTETILLVEDEAALRGLVEEVLEEAGYTVHTAVNGLAGLSLAKEIEEDIDLLLTDLVMPGLGGMDLAEAVGALRPTTRVLYMTGHARGGLGAHRLEPGMQFLMKPFKLDALLRRIRSVLDA